MGLSSSPQSEDTIQWRSAVFAGLSYWIGLVIFLLLPKQEDPWSTVLLIASVSILVGLVISYGFQNANWVVVIWVPVMVWTGFGILTLLYGIISESGGGANPSPLGGAVLLIGLGGILFLGLVTVIAWVWRPKAYPRPVVALALINTLVLSLSAREAYRHATLQEIILHVLDSAGKPLPGVRVNYTRYGYGSRGSHVYDGRGDGLVTGDDGVARIPSREMRYETQATLRKMGFRPLHFTLGMQYSKWDTTRQLVISTDETKSIASGNVSVVEPVTFSLCVSPESDAPDRQHPLKFFDLLTDIGSSPGAKPYLNLKTGKFSADPTGDLHFELFFEKDEGGYERPRLRITGLNGAKVLQVPPHMAFSEAAVPYESLYRIAPLTGYWGEVIVERPGDIPGPMIYVSARNGTLYGRLTADAWGRSGQEEMRCRLKFYVNETGDRRLE
jgi:hypothetical protein